MTYETVLLTVQTLTQLAGLAVGGYVVARWQHNVRGKANTSISTADPSTTSRSRDKATGRCRWFHGTELRFRAFEARDVRLAAT